MVEIDREKLKKEAELSPEELLKMKLEEIRKNFKRPTILVCGYTGVGKTTLLQKIFGKELISDDKINASEPCTKEFDNYQNERIKCYDSRGFVMGEKEEEFVENVRKFVRSKQDNPDVDEHIHLVWYCIAGPGARITPFDLRLIKNIFQNVIVVITKKDITKPEQLEGMIKKLINEGIKKERIIAVAENDDKSITDLVELSYQLLPAAYKDAFLSAQIVNIENKEKKCATIIHEVAASAAGIGAIPIPISDTLLITPLQAGMIALIGGIMGMPMEGTEVMATFLPLISAAIGIQTASSLTKLIPGLGSAINAAVAGALTEAVGWMALKYFKKCAMAKIKGELMPHFVFDREEFKIYFKEARARRKE
jgi:uncharacterized protein (DUF697 family)/predicted GTPase